MEQWLFFIFLNMCLIIKSIFADVFQETLKELFPSLKVVERYREVVIFTAGLMKDPRPLVQYVYEMQVEYYLMVIRTSGVIHLPIDPHLFKWLHAESTVPLPHPLHNKYINYYDHLGDERKKRPLDTAQVYWPSRVYHFINMRHKVELDRHTEGEEFPPCAMLIYDPDEAVSDSLFLICSEIFKHQAVNHLYMVDVTSNSLEAPRLTNPRVVSLVECKLPYDFVEKILRQLKGSGESLQFLRLDMNLAPFESLLDELFEDLVAHHQRKRKAGLAQRKLWLELREGFFQQPTNLSDEFWEKWRNRCEKVDSIHCMIRW